MRAAPMVETIAYYREGQIESSEEHDPKSLTTDDDEPRSVTTDDDGPKSDTTDDDEPKSITTDDDETNGTSEYAAIAPMLMRQKVTGKHVPWMTMKARKKPLRANQMRMKVTWTVTTLRVTWRVANLKVNRTVTNLKFIFWKRRVQKESTSFFPHQEWRKNKSGRRS